MKFTDYRLLITAFILLFASCDPCDDGDACTIDSWAPVDHVCYYQPIDCTDSLPCTDDFCVNGICFHTRIDCNDGVRCTIDDCINGNCVNIQIQNCIDSCDNDDNDPCTNDTIISGMLVCNYPIDCDDNDPCTDDFCIVNCNYQAIDCNDGEPCTDDYCDSTGCINVNHCKASLTLNSKL